MTRTLFLVPRSTQRRRALACVWTATGNLRQPLARTWVERETRSGDADRQEIEPELQPRLVCA